MARLSAYIGPVQEMSRDDFVAAQPDPFLLLRRDKAKARPSWTFKTQTFAMPAPTPMGASGTDSQVKVSPKLAKYDVFPICKAPDTPWPERISVGRAANNDVVLPDTSVSKLHAHFQKGEQSQTYLVDAGSRNGTRVNDKKLSPGEQARIEIGDAITFGRTTVWVVGANQLYEFIVQQLETVV